MHDEIFYAVHARTKRSQGITGQTIEAQMRGTMCQITEYELETLRDEIARLTAALERAVSQVSDLSTKLGKAEGKLLASETYGVVEGWKSRAEKAEAERDAIAAAAFEAAASEQAKAQGNIDEMARDGLGPKSALDIWTGRLVAAQEIKSAIRALATEPQRAALDRLIADRVAEAVKVKPVILILPDGGGICVGGRWHGWLMRRHADGQWISIAKLAAVDPFPPAALAADGEA